MVRIKYYISCGAVPTSKVQRFLSYYDLMPLPWYYKSIQRLNNFRRLTGITETKRWIIKIITNLKAEKKNSMERIEKS